ncbi:MAG: SDR family oxidoreductase [Gracilibacteraceae bacterium]|jgi:NAD(P)-dependent dehydrogenase (short-subunit alcohol dehydrogenase family)|nr:SDR family oxidoreductase [Gracilibacteraceae bacterium]
MAQQLLDFGGKVVLITGGRSGIGQSAALAFARQDAKVVIAGRSNADDTLSAIKKEGGEAIFVKCDVSKSADVQNLVQTIIKTYGRLDVAVNNSGLLPVTADLEFQTEEDFDQIIAVDLKGVFLCMKYEIPEMLKNETGGAIINVGSVVSLVADPGMAPYVAAKHGVAGLTRAAAMEYIKKNIRINCIAPGFTATEMTSGWMADPVFCEVVKSFNFANRIAAPEEMAGILLYLASPLASFQAGAVIAIDAAQTAH